MSELEVCLLLREQHLAESGNRLVALMSRIERAGLQGVAVGDHVTFQGAGIDGLISAAALIAAHDSLLVKTIIYLVPLRHPVAVARQVATLTELGPGRFTFGVGVGGEDPDEFASVEVTFAARGARADEALELMERLRSGRPVTHHGRFYNLDEVVIAPAARGWSSGAARTRPCAGRPGSGKGGRRFGSRRAATRRRPRLWRPKRLA